MTLLTIMTIAGNYPDNLLIDAGQDNTTGKFGGFIYIMSWGSIHRLLVSSAFVYESAEQTKEEMNKVVSWCCDYSKQPSKL